MPENGHVSQDQCETRRNHCTAAMTAAIRRIETGQDRYAGRLADQVTELIRTVTAVDSRARANTHRLNWLYVLLGGVILAVLTTAVLGGVYAAKAAPARPISGGP